MYVQVEPEEAAKLLDLLRAERNEFFDIKNTLRNRPEFVERMDRQVALIDNLVYKLENVG